MKRDVFDGLKIEALMEKLDIPRYAAAGVLAGIWQITQRFYPRGDIGRATNRQIAERIGWPQKSADKLINALTETRWLDLLQDDGRLYVHDWHEHCEDSVHRVLARKHLFFANGATPNWRRLEKPYIYDAERFYTGKGVTLEICAESAPNICVPLAPSPLPQPKPLAEAPICADSALGSDSAESHSPPVEAPGPDTHRRRRTTPATPTPPAPRKATDDEMRVWSQQALTAKAAGLPIPPKPGGTAPATNGTHTAVTGILSSIATTPDPQSSHEALLTRINAVTGDSKRYMDWWDKALPAITAAPQTAGALLAALDYAADCGNEATRAAKGLGPLKSPGGYVLSKTLIAARGEKVVVPPLPTDAPQPATGTQPTTSPHGTELNA